MQRFIAAALVVLVVGCSPNRVALRPVPERTAPLAERQRAYSDLKPESALQTTTYRNGAPISTNVNWLMLGDGTRVSDPRDLLPAVDATSATARYAKDYEEKSEAARPWLIGGFSGIGASVVIATAGFLAAASENRARFDDWMRNGPTSGNVPSLSDSAGFKVGLVGVGVFVVAMAASVVGIIGTNRANTDRISAFLSYPRALEQHLGLDGSAPSQDTADKASPFRVDASSDVPYRVALVPGR